MRVGIILLVVTAAVAAQEVPASPAELLLYGKGVQLFEKGRYELARLTLQTLINVYPRSEWRQPARAIIRASWVQEGIADPDPMLLFQEGETRATAGNYEAARLAWQTLINLYPSSESAGKARQRMRDIEIERRPTPEAAYRGSSSGWRTAPVGPCCGCPASASG